MFSLKNKWGERLVLNESIGKRISRIYKCVVSFSPWCAQMQYRFCFDYAKIENGPQMNFCYRWVQNVSQGNRKPRLLSGLG